MKYRVIIGGHQWAVGPEHEVATIREGRAVAEEYGDHADWGSIRDGRGREVALHMRSAQRDRGASAWYRATPSRMTDS